MSLKTTFIYRINYIPLTIKKQQLRMKVSFAYNKELRENNENCGSLIGRERYTKFLLRYHSKVISDKYSFVKCECVFAV